MVVSLWSGPRNCSTALMYSFAQRSDFRVVDEPLFAHFLHHTGVNRPSRDEVLQTMPWRREDVLVQFQNQEQHVFLKHMANHLEGWPSEDFTAHRHVILTRHPRKVLKSYRAHISEPTALDLCYDHQLQWLEHCEASGWPVVVLDSDRLVQNPVASLTALTNCLGLPFEPSMLEWPAGGRPEDGVWAKYWYHQVYASTGWAPAASGTSGLPEVDADFLPFIEELEPLYAALRQRAIN